MAENDAAFPKLGLSVWWRLREQFKNKVPTTVTPSYLATATLMEEKSARVNVLPPLKRFGLVDESGKPTDLAYEWRDDEKYPEVCKKLWEKIYPQEVRDLFHSPTDDPEGLIRWFMNYARVGKEAAKMFTRFYQMLVRANPQEGTQSGGKEVPSKTKAQRASQKPKVSRTQSTTTVQEPETEATGVGESEGEHTKHPDKGKAPPFLTPLPQLHINIQLHISPESTADQIDKIFESMAKHLKDLGK